MSEECQSMKDFIVGYINDNINEFDKIKLINHLSICPECRKEFAITLELSKLISNTMKDVPKDIMKGAFSLIPKTDKENVNVTLADLKSALNTLKIIPCVLSTTKKSIKLALQFI
ncbi:hypothetical protein [Proteiniborus sp. MB09-C3]|uniref:hypothetical protein n=1 Tax=Proteiniborus sp. MB09-C3 TaxID=3050072 RepID=UPI002556AFAE|nr:hypothetical protein [Proteiniborus sp. MB09-C3]WIV12864.1 hypothetical protein QO263_03885 [Proteiniborus sp. MB09-C3]